MKKGADLVETRSDLVAFRRHLVSALSHVRDGVMAVRGRQSVRPEREAHKKIPATGCTVVGILEICRQACVALCLMR